MQYNVTPTLGSVYTVSITLKVTTATSVLMGIMVMPLKALLMTVNPASVQEIIQLLHLVELVNYSGMGKCSALLAKMVTLGSVVRFVHPVSLVIPSRAWDALIVLAMVTLIPMIPPAAIEQRVCVLPVYIIPLVENVKHVLMDTLEMQQPKVVQVVSVTQGELSPFKAVTLSVGFVFVYPTSTEIFVINV